MWKSFREKVKNLPPGFKWRGCVAGGGGEGEELLFLPTPLPLQKWLFSKANISFLFFHILLIAKLLVNLPIFGFFGFKIWFNAIVHNTYIHVLSTSRAICLRITPSKTQIPSKTNLYKFLLKKKPTEPNFIYNHKPQHLRPTQNREICLLEPITFQALETIVIFIPLKKVFKIWAQENVMRILLNMNSLRMLAMFKN